MAKVTEFRLVLDDGSMFGTTTTDPGELERLRRIAIRHLAPSNRVPLRVECREVTPWTPAPLMGAS